MAKIKAKRKNAQAKPPRRSPAESRQGGGGRALGEGENFGKGQTRRGRERVRGEEVTRSGMRGLAGKQRPPVPGGGAPEREGLTAGAARRAPQVDLERHEITGADFGGEPSEPPLQSSTRPDDLGYERDWDET